MSKPSAKSSPTLTQADRSPDIELHPLVRWLVLSLMAAGFTLCIIQYISSHSKLQVPLYYDDVGYATIGLRYLEQLYASGLQGITDEYFRSPPHAPLWTLHAIAAFAIFGIHDWSIYAANFLVALAIVIVVDRLLRWVPFGWRMVGVAFALTVPVAGLGVSEFRPDVTSSLLMTAGCWAMVRRLPAEAPARRYVWIGCLFGLAMLCKTSTFPLTLALFCFSSGLMICTAFLSRPPAASLPSGQARSATGQQKVGRFVALRGATVALLFSRPRWRAAGVGIVKMFIAAAAMAAVAGPHFVYNFTAIWGYISTTLWGANSSVWSTPGEWWTVHFPYYLTGFGGELTVGNHLWIMAGLVVVGLLIACWRWSIRDASRGRPANLALMGCGLALLAVAWTIPTFNHVKQQFFGVPFSFLLLFLCFESLRLIVDVLRPYVTAPGHRFVGMLLVALVLTGLSNAQWPRKVYARNSPSAQARSRVAADLYAALRGLPLYEKSTVFFTTVGYINADLMAYLSMSDDFKQFDLRYMMYTSDIPTLIREMNKADFVVAAEEGNSESFAQLVPLAGTEDETLAALRQNPLMVEHARFPTGNAKSMFLFAREGSFGIEALSGLGRVEGPYPQWKLGRLRWAVGPSAVGIVRLPPGNNGHASLTTSLRKTSTVTAVRVLVNGTLAASMDLTTRSVNEFVDLPLIPVRDGDRIEFQFDGAKPGVNAALFKRLMTTSAR
jgi:hypothetical protein